MSKSKKKFNWKPLATLGLLLAVILLVSQNDSGDGLSGLPHHFLQGGHGNGDYPQRV